MARGEYFIKSGPSKWGFLLDSWYEGKPVYFELDNPFRIGSQWLRRIDAKITAITRHRDDVPGTLADFWLFIAKIMYPIGTYDDSGIRIVGSYSPNERRGHINFCAEYCDDCASALVLHKDKRYFCGSCMTYPAQKRIVQVFSAPCPICNRIAEVKFGLIECRGCGYLQHYFGQPPPLEKVLQMVDKNICGNCHKPTEGGYGRKCAHCGQMQDA